MKRCKFIRSCYLFPSHQPLAPLLKELLEQFNYDWVIITEDQVLTEVVRSDLPLEMKLRILPVQNEKDFFHLHSKINLSRLFSANQVPTPPFRVARNREEALAGAEEIGYPVLLKLDSSGGGSGVFEIQNSSDFDRKKPFFNDQDQLCNGLKKFQKPILIQKMIRGKELDLSALYFEGNLIHFNYATVERQCSKFGVSSLRSYRPLSLVPEEIFQELRQIGKALGAHGFVNIACMETEGRRLYFEADMRPTVWVEFPRFFGEDPALRIRDWFLEKKVLTFPVAPIPDQPSSILLPYFLRLSRWELLSNRYNVWRFIPKEDRKFIFRLLMSFLFRGSIKAVLIQGIKKMVPLRYHNHLRSIKKFF